jgi:hypothetical protein
MSHQKGERARGEAHLLPTKEALTALKSDVTFESACLELCDNSLDAWKRTSNRTEPAHIEIYTEEYGDRTELVIRDDTGGVPRDRAAMLFGIGRSAKTGGGTIGTFGVGAKKGLVNLGIPFRITSQAVDEPSGWTYRITNEWFEREDDWSVPVYESTDVAPGTTEIRIEDLNYDWTEQRASNLRTRLGEAYNLFLSDSMQTLRDTSYDLSITVDGKQVEAQGVPDWSFTPFDGLYPRRYKGIEISSETLEEPVKLHITAGLIKRKDTRSAGTDIYCQARKVASGLRDSTGGFDSGSDGLGAFGARHERLKIIIELETTGDGQQLPWDTQKSSIDRHNPIMQGTSDSKGVYNWLRRTCQQYFDANADQVPTAFVEPYSANSPCAANDGRPMRHDFSGRKRVTQNCRPSDGLSEINSVMDRIEAQVLLGVQSEAGIQDWQRPSYNTQLASEVDDPTKMLTPIDGQLPETVVDDPYAAMGEINELARIHLENGVYCPDHLEDWQEPTYTAFFEQHGSDQVPGRTSLPGDLPRTPEDMTTKDDTASLSAENSMDLYSSQTTPDDATEDETAEVFLVLGGETSAERGAKVLETTRNELCKRFDVERNAGDDILWEHVRHHLNTSLE